MKNLWRINKYVVLIIGIIGLCAVAFSRAAEGKKKSGRVEIGEALIVIHPTIELKARDQRKMEEILAQYDKRLYTIRTITGAKTCTLGDLPNNVLKAEFRAEATEAHGHQGKDYTDKQVNCERPCIVDGVHLSYDEKKKLVDKLRPILEHY
jgi:hypothetical protein